MGEAASRLRALGIVVSAVLVAALLLFSPPSAQADDGAAGTIVGQVTAADTGLPIAGATVEVMGWTPTTFRYETETDANGAYELAGVPSDAPDFVVSAHGPEGSPYGFGSSNQLQIAEGEVRTVDLVVKLAPRVDASPETVCLGSTLTLHGSHWGAGGQYNGFWIGAEGISGSLLAADAVNTVVTVGEDGTFEAEFPTNADAAPGAYTELSFQVVGHDSFGTLPVTVTAQDCDVIVGSTPTIEGIAAVGETLTAQPGVWTEGASLSYQWFANEAPIASATAATLTLAAAQAGKVLTVRVTGTKPGYDAVTETSVATAAVALGTLSTPIPTITGTLAVGSTLTASPGAWTTGAALTYQWYASGVLIGGATSSTYKLTTAQADKSIFVRVTGALSGYAPASKASASTPKVITAGTPTISGSARTGATLTGIPGAWTSSTAFAYQWYANGAAIAGATRATFVPTSAQDAKTITVRVTGTKAGYSTVAKTSAATLRVMRFSAPSISGSLYVGSVITAKPNTWSAGTLFAYQWYANGVAISGATYPTFTLGSSQRDKQISVRVTGKQTGFTTSAAMSSSTARVATTASPSISGVFMVGGKLTAKPNTWTTGTVFTYQWLADGLPISGATSSTFVLGSAQRDKQIAVSVTGRKSGYATVTRTSSRSVKIALTATPTIGGTLMVGSTLTARTGSWTSNTSFTYQWLANGSPISGANKSTFTPSKAYVGKTIMVKVVGAKSGYQTISRGSAASAGVKSGKAWPATKDNCPSGYLIKGNQTTRYTTDWIYHVPGGQYYAVTDPEECFATETAAKAWGYRASLR